MNSSPLFILDTFRLSQKENPFLPFHVQKTFEAVRLIRPEITHKDIIDLYLPFQKTPSQADQKCRIAVDPHLLEVTKSEITPIEDLGEQIKLDFATHRQQKAGRGLQNYKTSDRKYWDDNLSLKWPGTDDVIGINEFGQVTETSRFNLFLKIQDQVYTPTLDSGCVNGAFRRFAFTTGFVEINQKKYSLIEKDFLYSELNEAEIYIGNSLRGIAKAILAIA